MDSSPRQKTRCRVDTITIRTRACKYKYRPHVALALAHVPKRAKQFSKQTVIFKSKGTASIRNESAQFHMLMSSGPLTLRKWHPDGAATALASKVLPVHGGPYSSTPLLPRLIELNYNGDRWVHNVCSISLSWLHQGRRRLTTTRSESLGRRWSGTEASSRGRWPPPTREQLAAIEEHEMKKMEMMTAE